jgi:hypothetical protein
MVNAAGLTALPLSDRERFIVSPNKIADLFRNGVSMCRWIAFLCSYGRRTNMMLEKYSIGIGDRFGRQGKAQLRAIMDAESNGALVTPVWNKSFREHSLIGTSPSDVRKEADAAVVALGWRHAYRVDADHVGLKVVDGFIEDCDFFTLDVADFIGKPAHILPEPEVKAFVERCRGICGDLALPGLDRRISVSPEGVAEAARKYVPAVREAGRLYRHIVKARGADTFVTEVSMDETERPQTPSDMLAILAALADEAIPAQTVAPKFTGRFNKGVDYVGDLRQFAREFEEDVAVIRFAVERFGLPAGLKLSVHSGSDKFSLYPVMRRVLAAKSAGIHLKTAGTTWLEEVAGLAQSGGDGLDLAKRIYSEAYGRLAELCKPYATVIDIRIERLPTPDEVDRWDGKAFVSALEHDRTSPAFRPDLRQLVHVSFKVAAEMGPSYLAALDRHAAVIGERVRRNLYERHLKSLFVNE